jgi:DNA-binding XRE family transcriptional regulator
MRSKWLRRHCSPVDGEGAGNDHQTTVAKGTIVKTEKGRGRGRDKDREEWSLVKDLIELFKQTEVITITPEQRERAVERARRQTELWRSSTHHPARPPSGQPAEAEGVSGRRAASRRRLRLAGRVPARGATAAT